MKSVLMVFRVISVMVLVIILFALPLSAQEPESPDPGALQVEPGLRPPSTLEYGTKDIAHYWIPAEAFNQRGTPNWVYMQNGYIHRIDGNRFFVAPINLPAGADIVRIKLYCYDSNATENIAIWLTVYTTENNSSILMLGNTTIGSSGYTTIEFDPFFNNPQLNIFNNYDIYTVIVDMNTIGNSTLRFKGVRISYVRRISPAPATATFSDVPTTHGFFRNIEALAASGITTGFSDGTFKPSDYVTRGQMAAFLSRALGLHHPDPWN